MPWLCNTQRALGAGAAVRGGKDVMDIDSEDSALREDVREA